MISETPIGHHSDDQTNDTIDLGAGLRALGDHSKKIAALSLVAGVAGVAASFLITPQFTAKTTFLPPQSSGSGLGNALAALGPLAGLAGGGASKGSGDMYVTLLGSETVTDRLVEQFKLRDLYESKFRFEARDTLRKRSRIAFSKRDGVISIEVDDTDPKRSAQIANQYVQELRRITATMTLTEAQRRRTFFETQLQQTRDKLTEAQRALQGSGFNQGALRAEPKAAAEEYGRLKAELTAAEVRLNALRRSRTDSAPEVAQANTVIATLRSQLQSIEQRWDPPKSDDYVGKYREFKYQETLFELLAKQYEAARLDESKDDNSIQVIDPAQIPEHKSKPKRASIGIATTGIAALLLSLLAIGHGLWLERRKRSS